MRSPHTAVSHNSPRKWENRSDPGSGNDTDRIAHMPNRRDHRHTHMHRTADSPTHTRGSHTRDRTGPSGTTDYNDRDTHKDQNSDILSCTTDCNLDRYTTLGDCTLHACWRPTLPGNQTRTHPPAKPKSPAPIPKAPPRPAKRARAVETAYTGTAGDSFPIGLLPLMRSQCQAVMLVVAILA